MKVLCILAAAVACSTAQFAGAPIRHPMAQAELDKWISVGKPDAAELVEVTFAIKQTNLEVLERVLNDVSDPSSPNYGDYMTFKEMAEIVHGRPESVAAVLRTLNSVGVKDDDVEFTLAKEYATVHIPVSTVEKLFQADMSVYVRGGRKLIRSKTFTLPESISDHVDFVSGVDHFPPMNLIYPVPAGRGKVTQPPPVNPEMVNPTVIDSDYNIGGYVASNERTTQAIASFMFQYYNKEDLKLFQERFNLALNPIAKTVGFDEGQFPGDEADLDVEYITGTGRKAITWVEYVVDGFVDSWTKMVIGLGDTAPLVHSISYGTREIMYPVGYLDRTSQDFMKIGMSGRSVMVASGDSGVDCYNFTEYLPVFPTDSPYVTSVGGTNRTKEGTMSTWDLGGGGFSNHFPTADYQKAIVEKYLDSGATPPFKYFNQSGRAYPDVSAYAWNCEIVYEHENTTVGGTSCASPIFAGVVSLLNDVRLNKGLKPLGFLNPLLYKTLNGRGFFDITTGTNSGFIPENLCGGGFKAVPGWDPATGYGSPNFGVLKTLV